MKAFAGPPKKTREQEAEDWERAEIERLKAAGIIPQDVTYQKKGKGNG